MIWKIFYHSLPYHFCTCSYFHGQKLLYGYSEFLVVQEFCIHFIMLFIHYHKHHEAYYSLLYGSLHYGWHFGFYLYSVVKQLNVNNIKLFFFQVQNIMSILIKFKKKIVSCNFSFVLITLIKNDHNFNVQTI